MVLVKGQACRLNGPVPQTCGLGAESSEGIDNTKRTLRANNSTVWVWFLPPGSAGSFVVDGSAGLDAERGLFG